MNEVTLYATCLMSGARGSVLAIARHCTGTMKDRVIGRINDAVGEIGSPTMLLFDVLADNFLFNGGTYFKRCDARLDCRAPFKRFIGVKSMVIEALLLRDACVGCHALLLGGIAYARNGVCSLDY